jgi:ABC-2 type transport system ATP-binding protein
VLHPAAVEHDGDPGEGIRILRDGYEDERRALLKNPDGTRRKLAYEIGSFDVETEMRGDSAHLTARLGVDINEPTVDWGVGFSIETPLGMRLYNMTTFDGPTLPNTPGRHELVFEIPDVRLGPGKYLINIGLGNKAGKNYDLATPAGTFDIPGNDYGNGVLHLTPTVTADVTVRAGE